MTNIQQVENELWETADQLRANSKLTAAEYAMPVLGLIFLRDADNRFKAFLPEIEASLARARHLLLPKLMPGQLDVSRVALPAEASST